MKHRLKLIILMLACIMTLTGCWDQRIYEESGFVLNVGIEKSSNNKLLITITYPVIGAQEKNAVDIINTESTLLRGARENTRYFAPRNIEGGKVQQILISDSLAAEGVHDLLEIYQRDATNPAIAYVVVVEGSPNELLKGAQNFKNKPRVAFYIFQLLQNNVKLSNIPNTKVFDFDINYFAPGLDPITPMIKLDKDAIRITGCALFSGDKMTGKLDTQKTIMLLGLMNQLTRSDFIFDDPKLSSSTKSKYGISASLQKPKRKIVINFDEEGIPIINIDMKYNLILDEYKWDDTDDSMVQKKLEGIMNKDLTDICNETIKSLQKANCDPIGFGNMIRAKYHDYWESIKWADVYKDAEIKVNVKTQIISEGVIK